MADEHFLQIKQGATFEDFVIPSSDSGTLYIQTMVDAGRDMNGNTVGQPIGSDKIKYEISNAMLTDAEFHRLLLYFDRAQGGAFVNIFKVYDPRVQDFVEKTMYIGNRQGRPFKADSGGNILYWRDTTLNIIEV